MKSLCAGTSRRTTRTTAVFGCATCAREAGRLVFLRAGASAEHRLAAFDDPRIDRIVVRSDVGAAIIYGGFDPMFLDAREAIAYADIVRLAAAHPPVVAFWCGGCAQTYCPDHRGESIDDLVCPGSHG